MGFNIAVSPKYWTPVDLQVTGEDGRTVTGRIRVQFNRPTRDELKAFIERNRADTPTAQNMLDRMADWADVSDENGAMPFTPENVMRLEQNIPGSMVAIAQAYIRSASGAREGN